MPKFRFAKVAFFLFILITPASDVFGDRSQVDVVTIEELTEALRTKDVDRITGRMRAIMKMYGHERQILLDFLMELWTGRQDKRPSLPWKIIKSDRVRIEIADVLLQARNNKLLNFDPQDMVTFAERKLDALNQITVVRSAAILGLTETDRAVAILHKEALRKDRNMFRLAVGVLTSMCNPSAEMAVETLLVKPLEPSKRDFLLEMKDQRGKMKKQIRLCDRY